MLKTYKSQHRDQKKQQGKTTMIENKNIFGSMIIHTLLDSIQPAIGTCMLIKIYTHLIQQIELFIRFHLKCLALALVLAVILQESL